MKTIILFLLSALTSFAATTYPVLTDVPQRTFTGGGTNVSLLSGTNTYTGTNTFPPASLYPANMIGMRVLWCSSSNIYIPTVTVNATSNATNTGDYVNTTHIGYGTIPPLLSSNSMLLVYGSAVRSNANASTATLNAWIGPNTNFLGTFAGFNLALGNGQINGASLVMPGGSMSSWVQGASFATPQIYGTQAFFDGTVSNTIYFGTTTPTSFTNLLVYGLRIIEIFAP